MNTTGFPIDFAPQVGQLSGATLAEHCAARYERYGMRGGLPVHQAGNRGSARDNPMYRSTNSFLRLATILLATETIAGCMAIPAPQFGPGPPPMLTPKKAHTLGAAPVT